MELGYERLQLQQAQPVVMQVQDNASLAPAISTLELPVGQSTLVLIGGASKLSESDYGRVRSLFTDVLAPLAERWNLTVVDGGTDAGIMKMMGETRAAQRFTFPLIGAAPVGLVNFPASPSADPDAAELEDNHTHCFLIPGSAWGDESPWIAEIATQLGRGASTLAVLINGGEVTWKDARCNVDVGRNVVVIGGSGRTADILAAAIQGQPASDERATALVGSGLMKTVSLNDKPELINVLEQAFRIQ